MDVRSLSCLAEARLYHILIWYVSYPHTARRSFTPRFSGQDWESAWEASVLESTDHCVIWGYDHGMKSFGRQVSHASFSKKHRTHFQSQVQLGPQDKHGQDDDPKLYTLETIMRTNGHPFIDILKVDVEGYEFDTLKTLIQPYLETGDPLPFGQLQIELHVWGQKFPEFLSWWEMLEAAGLRPVMMEPNLVYVNYNRASGAELAEVCSNLCSSVLMLICPVVYIPKHQRTQRLHCGSTITITKRGRTRPQVHPPWSSRLTTSASIDLSHLIPFDSCSKYAKPLTP